MVALRAVANSSPPDGKSSGYAREGVPGRYQAGSVTSPVGVEGSNGRSY